MESLARWITAVLALGFLCSAVSAHDRARTPVRIPNIPGYLTLKCDFHIHTVFSDGSVWPDIRSEEAWREGLDAIAITDHIEYLPHKADLPPQHNRAYDIAKPHGEELNLTVIRGSEITRDMPPGHVNAIFLTDSRPLETEAWRDAVEEAYRQGAFIFWNHPGWRGQQPDGIAKWYPEHTALVNRDRLHGVEVVNSRDYYPEAHAWCLEKNLTMLSNSDIHNPLNLDYDVHQGDHRPLTLVFARTNSLAAIKEALFDRRTAVHSGNLLVGREVFLKPLFEASLVIRPSELPVHGTQRTYVQIQNESDVRYELEAVGELQEISFSRQLSLPPGKTSLLEVTSRTNNLSGIRELALEYRVKNLLVAPQEALVTRIPLRIRFAPAARN